MNRARLSPPNQESKPFLLHHGDIIQLGVDYQGGVEGKQKKTCCMGLLLTETIEIYRCVKMRIEINQSTPNQIPSSYW